jgi:hypothetical protein
VPVLIGKTPVSCAAREEFASLKSAGWGGRCVGPLMAVVLPGVADRDADRRLLTMDLDQMERDGRCEVPLAGLDNVGVAYVA